MPEAPPLLSPPDREATKDSWWWMASDRACSLRGAVVALMAGAATLVFAAGLLAGRSLPGEPVGGAVGAVHPCALPPGIHLEALSAAERDRVAERVMACGDLERGRITAAEYRAWLAAPHLPPPGVEPPAAPEMVWASSVREVSSQYGEDGWSATKALGPPDATPDGSDSPEAWASLEADAKVELIEVGLAGQRRLSGLEIVESHNPGAVSRVELLLAGGGRVLVHQSAAAAQDSTRRRIEFACTAQPVVGVRVTLDSAAVSGWNEIDAIGGQPCAE
jgi:hypothetical protein